MVCSCAFGYHDSDISTVFTDTLQATVVHLVSRKTNALRSVIKVTANRSNRHNLMCRRREAPCYDTFYSIVLLFRMNSNTSVTLFHCFPQHLRSLAQRRRSAPSVVFGKALGMSWPSIRLERFPPSLNAESLALIHISYILFLFFFFLKQHF